MASDLALVAQFTNVNAHEGPEGAYLFVGRNQQGHESAELLNQLQEEGQLRAADARMKRVGFHQVKVYCSIAELRDLMEVTQQRFLMGPRHQPIAFLRLLEPVVTEDDDGSSGWGTSAGGFANDAGNIVSEVDALWKKESQWSRK